MMLGIVQLGGYIGSLKKFPPGTKVPWIGLQRLHDITQTFLIFQNLNKGGVSSCQPYPGRGDFCAHLTRTVEILEALGGDALPHHGLFLLTSTDDNS